MIDKTDKLIGRIKQVIFNSANRFIVNLIVSMMILLKYSRYYQTTFENVGKVIHKF